MSRAQLTRTGDYLHGCTDKKSSTLGDEGMSPDAVGHAYEAKHREETY